MACNENTPNNNCLMNYAACIHYEGTVPEFSDLADSECITIEETTQDIYGLLTEIREEIDLTEMGTDCMAFPVKKVKDVLLVMEETICNQATTITTMQNALTALTVRVTALEENPCP